ncbi:MAG: Xaa-Pro peptidase family protein [Chloroflexi bacterium]|nr:Xaa-Pro peptidase family protein [Chloroflexota bacterium]
MAKVEGGRPVSRARRVQAELLTRNLDGVLVSNPVNIRYVTRFHGSAGILVITTSDCFLLVDPRYHERAAAEALGCEVIAVPPQTSLLTVAIQEACNRNARHLGFESAHTTVDVASQLVERAEALQVSLVPLPGFIESVRQVKDQEEIAALHRAAALTDAAMTHACALLRPGISESTLAWKIEAFMRQHGAESVAFPPIVAFGEHSSRPHHEPSGRKLQWGEIVLLDIGAQVGGYCGDLTRTLVVGEPPEGFEERFHAVLATLQQLEQSIRPGMLGSEADALAHQYLAQFSLSDFLTHPVGHAVGLEIHEAPYLAKRNTQPLPVGAVVTIEPAVYVPGWGGIRIEDCVVLGPGGTEKLTTAPYSFLPLQ